MYTSAGIPGTGIYAVHHIRSPAQQHPTVAGNATGFVGGVVIGLIIVVIAFVGYSLR
jgi:hypothetical protein